MENTYFNLWQTIRNEAVRADITAYYERDPACDQKTVFGVIENDLAGSVAGNVEDLEAVVADLERFSFFQPACRRE